ncbi:hypothetical protein CTI12_AA559760 [Artemisia annua]|uniref:Malectin-like domain-containing protein n=1 Tax=Artemisia annua TaxID=35608 RepID=A0A2U1KUU5_ARTAN|nr:hypothetical protein CTI12_AA559760 [Artemisia annua]
MDTLRVFTSRKKNCYSIPATKGQKFLVRASFNYGNYDRLSKPPAFDLHFDGYLWATVQTSMSGFIYYEVTYVTKGDVASVCVAQTKANQFPFISALEFRSVDSEVYKEVDEHHAFFLIARFAYGASQSGSSDSANIPGVPVSTRCDADSFSPPYGNAVKHNLNNYTVDSVANISLTADVDSDLPPLINAIEVFNIGDVLTDGTHSDDVAALTLLQNTFDVLGGWSGDPCLPAPYSYLDTFNLSGSFPDISSMDALEVIGNSKYLLLIDSFAFSDLHANSLTGTIPSFLGTMPKLQQFLDGNPSLCTTGKPCSSSPGTDSSPGSPSVAKGKKSSTLPVVLGITIPAFFLIWFAGGVFIILRRRKMKPNKPVVTG